MMPEAEARVMRHRVVITQGTQTAPLPPLKLKRQDRWL